MTKLELKDLVTKDAEVQLSNGKTLELRAATIRDFEWMGSFFQNKPMSDIRRTCVIVFRLLKDKSGFLPQEVDSYDDDGNPIKTVVTGPEKIMDAISGAPDYENLVIAMNVALGTEKAVKEVLDKATDEEIKKKNQQTGEQSLSSSLQNTDSV